MKSYTGATLFINENNSWWLIRGVPNPQSVWVDKSTGKAMEMPEKYVEPWQVPALVGMPRFTDPRIAVNRILPKAVFDVKDIAILDQEPAYSKGHDAFIYVSVKTVETSGRSFYTEADEYRLFNLNELEELIRMTNDNNFYKPVLKFMTSIESDSLS